MDIDNDRNPSSFSQYPHSQGFSSMPPGDHEPIKQSRLGIASFVLSLVAVLLIVIGIILAVVFANQMIGNEDFLAEITRLTENYEQGTSIDPNQLDEEMLGGAFLSIVGAAFLLFGALAIAFVGLILGIIGLTAKNRRKAFGIIGVVLNGLIVVGTVGFFIIGLVASFSV